MADEHSAQIDGALRFGSPAARVVTPLYEMEPQQRYHHTESTAPLTRLNYSQYDSSTLGNPVRVTHFDGGQFQERGEMGQINQPEKESLNSKKWIRMAVIIGVVLFVIAMGVVLFVTFAKESPIPSASAAESMTSEHVPFEFIPSMEQRQLAAPLDEFGGVQIDTFDLPSNEQNTEISDTTYYYPSPMATPRSITPLPEGAMPAPSNFGDNRKPPPRGSAGDGKPPPASWFGADAPTRGQASAEMELDQEFGNQAAISKIYGGSANSVLGGKNKPPYATVNADAARQIGWAEIDDQASPGGEIDANAIASGSARSMSELYQSGMAERQFREGSSTSTLVTPEQAASAAIGNSPDRSQQFAAGREQAKAITAESIAAIGSIYDKKRKAAAGLSAAAMVQERKMNDSNFDYYDVHSQQPI